MIIGGDHIIDDCSMFVLVIAVFPIAAYISGISFSELDTDASMDDKPSSVDHCDELTALESS